MKRLLIILLALLAIQAGYSQGQAPSIKAWPPGAAPPKDTAYILEQRRKEVKAINEHYKAVAPADTSDHLRGMTDDKRSLLITQALEEEERFKNYKEKTGVKKIQGEDMNVREIHVGDDDYEMQINKKGKARYFKNLKPITKITFDFEATRRMVDVLNTIRRVEKFQK